MNARKFPDFLICAYHTHLLHVLKFLKYNLYKIEQLEPGQHDSVVDHPPMHLEVTVRFPVST